MSDGLNEKRLKDAIDSFGKTLGYWGGTPQYFVSPKQLDSHNYHKQSNDKNHSWMCSIDKCSNMVEFYKQLDEEYTQAKEYAEGKLGDIWNNIPLEDQMMISIKASEFIDKEDG